MAITVEDEIKEVDGDFFITKGNFKFSKIEHPNLWGCMSGETPYWDNKVLVEYAAPIKPAEVVPAAEEEELVQVGEETEAYEAPQVDEETTPVTEK